MSISGVRTAYDAEEVLQVAQATGLVPTLGEPGAATASSQDRDQD
jgi:hypothetical protein